MCAWGMWDVGGVGLWERGSLEQEELKFQGKMKLTRYGRWPLWFYRDIHLDVLRLVLRWSLRQYVQSILSLCLCTWPLIFVNNHASENDLTGAAKSLGFRPHHNGLDHELNLWLSLIRLAHTPIGFLHLTPNSLKNWVSICHKRVLLNLSLAQKLLMSA